MDRLYYSLVLGLLYLIMTLYDIKETVFTKAIKNYKGK